MWRSGERVCQAYDVTRTNAYVIKSRLTTRLREMMTKLVGRMFV